MKENPFKEKWQEQIISETEHYYLGEQRQEERASWLLATASGLLVIIVTSFFGGPIPRWILITQSVFYFFSILFSLMGLLPYKGRKGIKEIFFQKGKQDELINLGDKEFTLKGLQISDDWSQQSLDEHIFHHYKSHYIRNLQKSKKVIISAILIGIGIFFTILTFCIY